MTVISPDLSVLQAQVVFDISGSSPVITLTNMSTGPNLAGITWWVVATSPSGTPIHEGSFANPDATGAWTTIALADSWPMPFNSIEWSGAPYVVSLFAQDSDGNVFELDKSATICRPTGNTNLSKNTYGIASTNVKVLCDQARIFFQDQTSTSYRGNSGTQTSSLLKVVYPLDPTYSIPAPFQISQFSSAMVPISYGSDNYQFLAASIYSYDQGDYVFIVIKYQELKTFSVLCNIDLMPLICEYQKLIDSIVNGTCGDVQSANQKLMLINPKFALVIMGIMQPLTGVDVPLLITQIEAIGGFDCDCCNAPSGIIPDTTSVIDGYTFSVNPTCGDISGNFSQVGTNIQLNLADKTYVFAMGTVTGTTAFTVTPATTGCVKTYSLNVSVEQLATDILTFISTNAGLVNLFNSIVTGSSMNLIVDGKCIFDSTATYDYEFTLANVPINTTFALVTGIKNGTVNISLNFSLNLTNLAAFQAYLNTLGLGTFVVTNPSGQTVLITSATNPNVLSNLTYSISAVNYIATVNSVATGYVALSANQVVQNIINYLCGLTDDQIVTSVDYTIRYVNASGAHDLVVEAGTSLSDFISALLTANATTINNGGSGGVTCLAIKAVFPASNTAAITPADVLYGTRNGNCGPVNFQEAFRSMISNMTSETRTLFCQAVVACGAGQPCEPYTYFNVFLTTYNATCSPIVGIEFTLT